MDERRNRRLDADQDQTLELLTDVTFDGQVHLEGHTRKRDRWDERRHDERHPERSV